MECTSSKRGRKLALQALSAPLFVSVEITSTCSCSCQGCYVKRSKGDANEDADLSTAAFRSLIGELRDLNPAKVTFTGGEPGEDKPRLFEAIAILRDQSSGRRLGLMTNGRHFDHNDMAIMGAAISWINVNLSPTLGGLDIREGDVDLMDRVLARVPTLMATTEAGIALDLNVTANAYTPLQLAGLCRLAKGIKARSLSVVIQRHSGLSTQPALPAELRSRVVEEIARWKSEYPARIVDSSIHNKRMVGSGAPNAELYVRANGNLIVSPAIQQETELRFVPGELRNQWRSHLSGFWGENRIRQVVHA